MENLQGLIDKLKTLDYLDVEIHTPLQECEHCSEKKADVELTINPYVHDIHNEAHWEFICLKCYGELCADI